MGNNEFGLKALADDQLLAGLASIVGRRNQITAEFLAYLAELDERQLFLDLGFSSLFEYCVVNLKLCESTAGRHIAAARVCRNRPEAFALVASGALHASALSLLRKHLTPENAAELFELCTHQSARKVEELLAARFPRPDVRDLVRRLPTRAEVALDVGCSAEQAQVLVSTREPRVGLTQSAAPLSEGAVRLSEVPVGRSPAVTTSNELAALRTPVMSLSREMITADLAERAQLHRLESLTVVARSAEAATSRRFEPLSADRYGVHFTADGEFCALLERVRGLAGHRLPNGDLMTLLKRGLEAYERELEKERFAVGGKARRSRSESPASAAPVATDALKPDRSRRELLKPGTPRPEASKPELRKPKASKPEDSKPEDSKPEDSKPESSKSEASKPEVLQANPRPSPNPERRHRLPAAVVRAVFLRDEKQCSYVARDGRRCGARRCLELDHIEPRAVGGEDTIGNLRLRCRAHNQRYAREYFGAARVDSAIEHARRHARGEQAEGPRMLNRSPSRPMHPG